MSQRFQKLFKQKDDDEDEDEDDEEIIKDSINLIHTIIKTEQIDTSRIDEIPIKKEPSEATSIPKPNLSITTTTETSNPPVKKIRRPRTTRTKKIGSNTDPALSISEKDSEEILDMISEKRESIGENPDLHREILTSSTIIQKTGLKVIEALTSLRIIHENEPSSLTLYDEIENCVKLMYTKVDSMENKLLTTIIEMTEGGEYPIKEPYDAAYFQKYGESNFVKLEAAKRARDRRIREQQQLQLTQPEQHENAVNFFRGVNAPYCQFSDWLVYLALDTPESYKEKITGKSVSSYRTIHVQSMTQDVNEGLSLASLPASIGSHVMENKTLSQNGNSEDFFGQKDQFDK